MFDERMIPRSFRLAFGSLLALALGCSETPLEDSVTETAAEPAVSNRNVGVHCTDAYQALPGGTPWLTPTGWTSCDRFLSEIKKEASSEFYYDLKGKKYFWENGGDGDDNSLEDVDLFFSVTHGGAWHPEKVEWGMWDYQTLAYSNAMKFGDERRGLSVFATYSCHTAEWTTADVDGNGVWDTWQRLQPMFSGGLRAHLSSQSIIYYGSHNDVGKIFAKYLNGGYSLRDAWYFGLSSTPDANDVAVIFTGKNATDCANRRDTMTWDNFDTYPRLTTFGNMCTAYWTDV